MNMKVEESHNDVVYKSFNKSNLDPLFYLFFTLKKKKKKGIFYDQVSCVSILDHSFFIQYGTKFASKQQRLVKIGTILC